MNAEPLISPLMLAALLAAGAATGLPGKFSEHTTDEPASANEVSKAAGVAGDSVATHELQTDWRGEIALIVNQTSRVLRAVRKVCQLAKAPPKRAVLATRDNGSTGKSALLSQMFIIKRDGSESVSAKDC